MTRTQKGILIILAIVFVSWILDEVAQDNERYRLCRDKGGKLFHDGCYKMEKVP